VFEVRGLMTGSESNMMAEDNLHYIGVIFLGGEGYLTVDANGFQVFMGEKRERTQHVKYVEDEPWSTQPHVENFLKAVRSRKRDDLHCDILEGHLSATMCHMANIAYRTGRALAFDPKREDFGADEEANRHVSKAYRTPYVVPGKV
jgi:hypothetical protein